MIAAKDKHFSARLALVKHAKTHGVRPAARHFKCSKNTVKLWLARYLKDDNDGLRNLSRAPKTCPHKTKPNEEKKVIVARLEAPCFGPQRLRDLKGVTPSKSAIARILRQNNLSGRRRKKHQKKNDLRAIKAKYAVWQRLQADTKPLYDIPQFWPQMKHLGLPMQQYSHRDVKSGAIFLDYADSVSTTYATLGSDRLLMHLKRWEAPLDKMILSTDNGSEYGGAERYERSVGYHASMQRHGLVHRFLPPRTPNAHGDVESMHRWCQEELFDLETFRSRRDFFEKVATYQLWWNFARPNYSKGGKTPAQILEEAGINPAVLIFPPADLDATFRLLPPTFRVGQDLPVDTGN
jgi:transposase